MKIALLTIWHVGNYGAELQAYATVKALKQLGHEVTIIDIRENEHVHMSLKSRVASAVAGCTLASMRFRKFWRRYFPDKTRHYRRVEELIQNPPEADVYVAGSDQVWNTDITAEKKLIYFLNFGQENVRRVSYASSFGKGTWDESEEITQTVRALLGRFAHLSAREQSGVGLLKSVFGRDGVRVVDPTLLSEDYSELTGKVKSQNTLVYYPLVKYPQLEEFCRNLSSLMGLKPINANKCIMLTRSIAWRRPSVEKWVKDIAEASFIVTPSFHGLAFSLIYRKQFIIINKGGAENRKARLTDLLSELGLLDRFFETFEEVWADRPWERRIDYDAVSEKLAKMRKESINYLMKALESAE